MAKSDSDSNGLRQDQPECAHAERGRVRREHQIWCCYRGSAHPRSVRDRPGVTELPGLTSDPIYTADRRGGILISSGPGYLPERVLNPSSRLRSVRCGRAGVDPGRAAFALHSECPVTLKGSEGRLRPGGGVGPRHVRIRVEEQDCIKPVELHPSRHVITHRVAWPEVGPSSRRSWVRSDRMRATRPETGLGASKKRPVCD
jgi:hypothetical protein